MNEGLNQRDVDSLLKRTSSGGKVTADSLTQREIDAILQKTTPVPLAPVVSEDIVPYNFSRPPRVSKDRRANLESIYTRFALSVQALLSSMLRMPIDVVVGSVEQAMFSEFILSLGTPCASFVFDIGDRMGGEGAVDVSTDFAFHLVDRLFGGPGDPQALQRPLTGLEQAVVRNVADRALGLLRESWQEHLAINPRIIGFESNPEMLQITSREDNVLVTNLEIRSTLFNGFITLCLPMSSLESFLQEKGSGRSHMRHADADALSNRAQMQESLGHAHLAVAARFPMLWLSARQIADLVPGKVLHTGQASDQPIEVLVNERLRFVGSLGQSRGHLGIRIVDRVQKPVVARPVQFKQGRVM
ncbi:MAG: flagellar motor switch protein FliM [Candidatus Eisenbacteria bacterium]|nr:flagellar motor switch protein FliM [Candidatus Eisenbacteria bacterium]